MGGIRRNYCSECGRYTCDCKCGTSCSSSPTTAPTVEVDERVADVVGLRLPALPRAVAVGWKGASMAELADGYTARQMRAYGEACARAALASKPPAREAAERQSIDTPEFYELLKKCYEVVEGGRMSEALDYFEDHLIAHIDTWGGAAPATGNTTQTAYVPLHVLEALRAGCKVATTLTTGKDADHTEAVQLVSDNH